MFELLIEDKFSSAHSLKNYKGNCENLHGHNWKVQVTVQGDKLNDIGLLMDFRDLKNMLKEVLQELDHTFLNDIQYFKENNTSSEYISKYIYSKLKEKLSNFPSVKLKKVTSWETFNSAASYFE